eukprot:TRINITY_DN48901_c0_g1_i1.p1 TRINITY_DN48901_c0_g1~~TRINITY_DN48901_c0_g1_i1.p1  ORF type:complete len:671 (-),score=92.79 TRINITY_DN48901_c0_g1_i1:478-2490(-)
MGRFHDYVRNICNDFDILQKQNSELLAEVWELRRQLSGEATQRSEKWDVTQRQWIGSISFMPAVTHDSTQQPIIPDLREQSQEEETGSSHPILLKGFSPRIGREKSGDFQLVERKQVDTGVKSPCAGRHGPKCSGNGDRAPLPECDANEDASEKSFVAQTSPKSLGTRLEDLFNSLCRDGEMVLSVADCMRVMKEKGFTADYGSVCDAILYLHDHHVRGGASRDVIDSCAFMCLMELELGAYHVPYALADLRKAFHKADLDRRCAEAQRLVEENQRKRKEEAMELPGALGIAMDTAPALAVVANALVLGISTDVDPEGTQWQVLEYVFTAFFLCELLLKLKLFGFRVVLRGRDWLWNAFDIFCVMSALVDMSITALYPLISPDGEQADLSSLTLLKMLRLARLARLLRLIKFKIFYELKVIVQGVFAGLRVLFWAVVLLGFLVFFLGIIMRKTVGEEKHELEFSTLTKAMFTIFRCVTDGCTAFDGTPLQERLRGSYGAIFMISYMLMFLVIVFGLFNLIMATFIDSVLSSNIKKKQHELGEHTEKQRTRVREMCWKLSTGNDGKEAQTVDVCEDGVSISRDIFNSWLKDPSMIEMLEDIDIETSTKFELFDVLDVDMGGELSFDEMVTGLMKLRGPISKIDIMAVRLKVRFLTKMVMAISEKLQIEIPS